MAILIVSPYWPWRDNTGAPQRVGMLLLGLSRVDSVDFLAYSDLGDPFENFREARGVRTLHSGMYPGPNSFRRRLLARLVGPERARIVSARRVVRRLVHELHAQEQYSLVLFVREMSWFIAGDAVTCPTIVDVDDFAEVVLQRWLDVGKNDRGEPITTREAARMRRRIRVLRNQHQSVARSGTRRLVVSATDAARVPGASSEVVPNAYPAATAPGDRPLQRRRNVLLFVGMHLYAPNADAAGWFATSVLPIIARQVPDVEFRIVGRADERVTALNALPHVSVTGPVADVGDELSCARAAVIPLRVGGGSRIKILEAMASSVPVVSTTIGAEGLDLRSGEHAFIADSAEELAAACVRVLQLDSEVEQMTRAARELAHQYAPDVIADRVRRIAGNVMRPAAFFSDAGGGRDSRVAEE